MANLPPGYGDIEDSNPQLIRLKYGPVIDRMLLSLSWRRLSHEDLLQLVAWIEQYWFALFLRQQQKIHTFFSVTAHGEKVTQVTLREQPLCICILEESPGLPDPQKADDPPWIKSPLAKPPARAGKTPAKKRTA